MNSNIFVVLSLFLLISCSQNSYIYNYICWNKKRTQAIAFSFDNQLKSVTIGDIHSYFILTSQNQPLDASMSGDTHKLQMNQHSITLEVIQDTVYVKTRIPSGQFVNPKDIKIEEDYFNQRRYHAVFPVVHKYVFDKKSPQLSVFYSPLFPPRRAIEQKFVHQGGDKYDIYPEKVKDLGLEESAAIFPPEEKTSSFSYPNCEDEGSYSLKKMIRSILKRFQFA